MKSFPRISAASFPAFFLLLASFPVIAGAKPHGEKEIINSCEICHGDKKVQFGKSVHNRRRIVCTDCHGGDASDLERSSMSPSKGFKGKPSPKQTVELCSSCHSNRDMMRQYSLGAGQAEEYLASRHGILFKAGDDKAAVCTDCHGSHLILPVADPLSAVNPKNVPETCAKCHSDEGLMRGYGIPSNQFENYSKSVHGRALLNEGNTAAPSCASCHGNHGALPPGVRQIENVCGHCHPNTQDAFDRGPHSRPEAAAETGQCAGCHFNGHRIEKASLRQAAVLCGKCHQEGSPEIEAGKALEAMALEAEQALRAAEAEVREARAENLPVSTLDARLREANTQILELAVAQHSLSRDEMERYAVIVKSISDEAVTEIGRMKQGTRLRRFGLFIVWAAVIWMVVLLQMKKYRMKKDLRA